MLSSQTRPNLCYEAFSLSMNLNYTKYKDAKIKKKVVMKAKQENIAVKYSHIGNLEVYADTSLGSSTPVRNKICNGHDCAGGWKGQLCQSFTLEVKGYRQGCVRY